MSNVVELRSANTSASTDVPDFIERIDISKMNDEQLDDLINGIRARRMKAFIIYQDTVEQQSAVAAEKAAAKVATKCVQIEKMLVQFDNNFEKLEQRINELRGLRLQAGMRHL